jgi:hypothetical protein
VSPKAKATDAEAEDESLKRLPGTGWQTRDGRFTITTASGTWSVTDEEQTDDLGLPLVRGPFRSLADAKAAIEEERNGTAPKPIRATRAPAAEPATATEKAEGSTPPKAARAKPKEEPEEPRWIAELEPADRRRAKRLITRLAERGVRDPEGVVRRDVAGDVATVARVAVAAQLAAALEAADKDTLEIVGRVLDLLAEGRDEELDVRWRLVDEENRPIGVAAGDVAEALKRNA